MFVVFEAKGFQYVGRPGERLRIPRLDSEIGEKVTFDKVLLVKNGDIKIGRPYIEGASIVAKIVEHGRYKKIIVFKFKKRKRYKRTRGHRQTYTEIEIKDIILGGTTAKKKVKEKEVKQEKEKITGKAKKKRSAEPKKAKKTTAEKKKPAGKAKKKTGAAKKAVKATKKTAKTKKTTTKKKKTAAKPKKTSAKAKKTKKSTSKTKKEKK